MKAFIISLAVIVILIFLIVILINSITKKNNEIKDLKGQINKLDKSLEILIKHNRKILEIKDDENSLTKEIENAKTSEDLIAIANRIVSSNNDRVHKQSDKKGNASTKTSKTGA